MGRKERQRKEKREGERKAISQEIKLREAKMNPWKAFWKRSEFWIISVCLLLAVAYPFVNYYREDLAQRKKSIAILHTTMGDITMELYYKDAPKTVKNFQNLAAEGYYNGITFHRVVRMFMIQTGDPTGTGGGGKSSYGGAFNDEINADSLGLATTKVSQAGFIKGTLPSSEQEQLLDSYADKTVKEFYENVLGYHYIKGVTSHMTNQGAVAMANSGPDTNTSQFFIITDQAEPHLNGRHTVFGQVTDGLDVAQKISEVPVDDNDKPISDVKITSIEFK